MTVYSYLPINETVSAATKLFADAIVTEVERLNPALEIIIGEQESVKSDETERSPYYTLETKYGIVVVFPDFREQSSKACTFNRGLARGMELEGFSEAEIDAATTLGKLVPATPEYIHVLGVFLSEDMGLQAQKGFIEHE